MPEDEGQHVQSLYPTAGAHGGQGRFALEPATRLTEASALVSPTAARQLLDAWEPFWDVSKAVLIEKSPPNLVRMRFLRALFPDARFIIVIRHPIAVSLATRRVKRIGMDRLVRHWLAGYANLVDDAEFVGKTALIRYEELMMDPAGELDRLFAFLSLGRHVADWPVRPGVNDSYFSRFFSPRLPWRASIAARLARRYEQQVGVFGYSLTDLRALRSPGPSVAQLRPPVRSRPFSVPDRRAAEADDANRMSDAPRS